MYCDLPSNGRRDLGTGDYLDGKVAGMSGFRGVAGSCAEDSAGIALADGFVEGVAWDCERSVSWHCGVRRR